MTAEPRQILGPPDPNISFDLECVGCGYNLLGLTLDDTCPECNTPVRASFRGRRLRDLGAEHTRVLARGARSVAISIRVGVFYVFLAVAAFIGLTFANHSALPGRPALMLANIEYVTMGVMVLVACLWARGWWLLATPEPVAPEQRGAETARTVCRVSGVLFAAALADACVAEILEEIFGRRVTIDIYAALAGFVLAIAIAVHSISFLLYARHLASRVPAHALARRARSLLKWTLAVGAWFVVRSTPIPFPPTLLGVLDLVFVLCALVVVLMATGLADIISRTIRVEAGFADPDPA